jgi:formylglycine-generating enzyme required for sulfatase activity
VKVECVLSGVTEPVDLAIEVYNGANKIAPELVENALSGERFAISSGGVKTFYIDPIKACGTAAASVPDFRVKVSAVPAADKYKEVLYKIVNLKSPYDVQDVTRAMLLNGEMGAVETKYSALHPSFTTPLEDVCIWTGVTNDVKYMTTHLVLRKIPAAGKEFMFRKGHSVSNEVSVLTAKGTTDEGIPTSFTSDFYIGVFELTQAQWLNVQAFPDGDAWETNALYSATRPVDRCYYSSRTRGVTLGLKWPEGSHTDVDEGTFFKRLQDRIGLVFDSPTEARWEFAYRAGTKSGLYTGMEYSFENFALISRQRASIEKIHNHLPIVIAI